MRRVGAGIAIVALLTAGVGLMCVVPMLPWADRVMSAERHASVADPPQAALTAFLLAPVIAGLAMTIGFVARRGRRATPLVGRGAGLAMAAICVAGMTLCVWVFVVLEALDQSGAP